MLGTQHNEYQLFIICLESYGWAAKEVDKPQLSSGNKVKINGLQKSSHDNRVV